MNLTAVFTYLISSNIDMQSFCVREKKFFAYNFLSVEFQKK